METSGQRMRASREALRQTDIKKFCKDYGLPESTWRMYEGDQRPLKSVDLADRYARILKVHPWWLMTGEILGDSGDHTLKLMSKVGAGSHVEMFPDGPVDWYALPKDVDFAVLVDGASQKPRYDNGDVIAVRRDGEVPPEDGLNREGIVRLTDGRLLLKTLRPGTAPGLYTLTSLNAEDIVDVEVEGIVPFGRRYIIVT